MLRSSLLLVATLVLCATLLAYESPSSSMANAAPTTNKKKKSAPAKKRKPVEVTDLMVDVGGTMCRKLAALVKRKRFIPGRRCDLFTEQLEGMASMTDALVNEMDMTQQDFVDEALKPHHYMQLQMHLKTVVKTILQKRAPSEDTISQELNKVLGQWILNVATQQTGHSSGLDKLPREALKNLRSMGIKMPSYGVTDDDETDEEALLMDDDRQWAAANSDDDDADEPDDGEL